jgi:hypothetical protein
MLAFILCYQVMTDPLCEAKEMALNAVNPYLFTIATLTGHVIRAYGTAYTVSSPISIFYELIYLKFKIEQKNKKGNFVERSS